jgi:cytochrome c5
MSHFPSRTLIVGALSVAMLAVGLAGCSSGTSGKDLVDSKCSICHPLDRITTSTYKTQAEWEASVAQMEAVGLEITDAERTAIVEYLVQQSAK